MIKIFVEDHVSLVENLINISDTDPQAEVTLQVMSEVNCWYEAMCYHDTIKMFSSLNISVVYLSGNTGFSLAIGAAVPEEKRMITETGIFVFSPETRWGQGTYKDLKIASEAAAEIQERGIALLDRNYKMPSIKGKTLSSFKALFENKAVLRADEMIQFGLRKIGEL